MPVDERKEQGGRVTDIIDQPVARAGAEPLDQLGGIVFQAGNDLPTIAPGSAPPRLPAFQNDRACSPLRQMDGGGKAGEPAADDADLRLGVLGKRCEVCLGDGCLRPE